MNKIIAALLFAALLVGFSSLGRQSALAAGPITGTACIPTAPGEVTCELWAKTGSLALPGTTVTFWGYASSAAGLAELPGPALVVDQGIKVTVILHNDLGVATSMRFEGQSLPTDRAGAAAGGTVSYVFTVSNAGTFLYEAGLLAGTQYQSAMGLYGALIVRPGAAGQAFASLDSAYTDEALVVLSEIDPALNGAGNPAAFDMRNFKAKYWLINGKAYPNTDVIGAAAGSSVLLHYVNAGQQSYAMAILGMNQKFLSLAGAELPFYRTSGSQLLLPGQSANSIAVIPASAQNTAKFAFYEAGALLHNNGSKTFGGMLTFIQVGGTITTTDTLGPSASALALSLNPTNGSSDVVLSASISDVGRGDANIQAAQFCIDSAACAAPIAMSAVDAAFDAGTEAVQATLSVADLAALSSSVHTLYVRGQDTIGNWGSFNTIGLNLDKTGPATSAIVQTPSISNGSVDVAIRATASDLASGGSIVTAGEYRINGGAAITMTVGAPGAVVSLDAMLDAFDMNLLAEGSHTLEIRGMDALGNWGAWASASLTLDKTGPVAGSLVTTPSDITNGNTSVRVDAIVTDSFIKVTNAELFIDTVGAPGTGLAMVSKDGAYDELSEGVYTIISQAQVFALANDGLQHTIYVRGRDAAGNWGTAASIAIGLDTIKPVVSNVTALPSPTNGLLTNATSFVLSATATDATNNIVLAEWYEGADPGLGLGVPFAFTPGQSLSLSATIDYVARQWVPGSHTVYVRAKDIAGNWSVLVSTTIEIVLPNNVFADGFESGSFSAWSTTGGTLAQISVTSGAAQAGSFKMAAAISGGTSGFVENQAPTGDPSYHARFYVNPNNLQYTTNQVAATPRTIFIGVNAANQSVFQVQLRRQSRIGNFQVRAMVYRAGGNTVTNWVNIPNNAYTAIEIDWSSATSASFRFYTAGVLRQTISGVNTSAFKLDTVRLGPQGNLNGITGTLLLDSFVSTRRSYIAP